MSSMWPRSHAYATKAESFQLTQTTPGSARILVLTEETRAASASTLRNRTMYSTTGMDTWCFDKLVALRRTFVMSDLSLLPMEVRVKTQRLS